MLDIPPKIQMRLDRMPRRRRNAFIQYIRTVLEMEKYIRIVRIGTVSWSYAIPKKSSNKTTYMPLHTMTKEIQITSVKVENELKELVGRVDVTKIEGKFTPYRIMQEIWKKNDKKLVGNVHGLTLVKENWRYNNLVKQKAKIEQMYRKIMSIDEHAQWGRKKYRVEVRNLLSRLIQKSSKEKVNNMFRYARDHKSSKWVSGVRWGSLTVEEIRIIVWIINIAAQKLIKEIDKLKDNEMIIWSLEVGFDAIRSRTGLDFISLENEQFKESYYLGRDARSNGWTSHIFGNFTHDEVREWEKNLIQSFAGNYGVEVFSPFIRNDLMWKELKENISNYYGYDGSNWQAVVGLILGSVLSTIFYGWPLLCSGANTTSLEGILAMIIVLTYVVVNVGSLCSFGDDVMMDRDMSEGIRNLIWRDAGSDPEGKTFLGNYIIEDRVRGIKLCRDDSEKMRSVKGGPDKIKYDVNIPDLQQKIGVLVAYGFMESSSMITENIKSKEEYIKPGNIIEYMERRTWEECLEEYNKKFSEWWK